ncbi:MarC family protein [Thermosulfuriphilus sp.]
MSALSALDSELQAWITSLVSIFIIVDPLGNIPLLLALTKEYPPEKTRETIRQAILVAAGVLILFCLAGDLILKVFGVRVPAFRVAGGVILFMIALRMIQALPLLTRSSPEEADQAGREKEEVAIVPLAVPILAGPGAITTVMVLSGQEPKILVIVSILTVMALTYVIFARAPLVASALGASGTGLFTRIMGLILAVIAVEFITTGLGELYPGWTAP